MSGGIDVIGYHLVTGIDTASQEDAGLTAVQIGRTEEVFRRTVTIAVTPCFVQVCLTILQALQRELHHLIRYA